MNGKWERSPKHTVIVDPLNGEPFLQVADVQESEIAPFVESLRRCPKTGLHNPFKVRERRGAGGRAPEGCTTGLATERDTEVS